jgi:PadR family transcriptional regulator, regulatory protein AphA
LSHINDSNIEEAPVSLRHAILGIVEFRPMHGYEIKRVLGEGISTFWPVHLAAIYPSLRRLEHEGLVAHRTEKSAEGRPDRKIFELTDAGREELARWRRLPPEGATQSKVPLYLKLLFAKPENLGDALHWIDKELETSRGTASQLRAELHDPQAYSTFFVRFMRESGLAHVELQIELLEDLRSRIQERLEARQRASSGAPSTS